jgi:hypothetical protein
MTLKEKFSLILMQFWASDWEGQCEQAAEEFAIGFADWFHANCYEDQVGYYTASELLETYKKEKGL